MGTEAGLWKKIGFELQCGVLVDRNLLREYIVHKYKLLFL